MNISKIFIERPVMTSLVMAAMSMAVLPVILIFLLAQKLVIEGVTLSGIKS